MASSNGNFEEQSEIDGMIRAMVPEVVLAVESLEVATPERIHACLEKYNIKATRSETEMALEYGCRLGVMEERKKYRLNPELRNAVLKDSKMGNTDTGNMYDGLNIKREGDSGSCIGSSDGDDYDDDDDFVDEDLEIGENGKPSKQYRKRHQFIENEYEGDSDMKHGFESCEDGDEDNY